MYNTNYGICSNYNREGREMERKNRFGAGIKTKAQFEVAQNAKLS